MLGQQSVDLKSCFQFFLCFSCVALLTMTSLKNRNRVIIIYNSVEDKKCEMTCDSDEDNKYEINNCGSNDNLLNNRSSVTICDSDNDNKYEINNWGGNDNLVLVKDRQRDAEDSELKIILMWNIAYGTKNFDIGHGRELFYKFKCQETRCVATDDR